MTWWQIYLLAGMVAIGWRVGTDGFRQRASVQLYEEHQKGFSPRQSFLSATVSLALAVLIWPIVVGRWIWKLFK